MAMNGYLAMIKFLMQKAELQANVDARDLRKRTLLGHVPVNSHLHRIKFFMQEVDPKADLYSHNEQR